MKPIKIRAIQFAIFALLSIILIQFYFIQTNLLYKIIYLTGKLRSPVLDNSSSINGKINANIK